jgi:hypothetical protein
MIPCAPCSVCLVTSVPSFPSKSGDSMWIYYFSFYNRLHVHEQLQKRTIKLLQELGWWRSGNYHYKSAIFRGIVHFMKWVPLQSCAVVEFFYLNHPYVPILGHQLNSCNNLYPYCVVSPIWPATATSTPHVFIKIHLLCCDYGVGVGSCSSRNFASPPNQPHMPIIQL